jgi:hypothetical protein
MSDAKAAAWPCELSAVNKAAAFPFLFAVPTNATSVKALLDIADTKRINGHLTTKLRSYVVTDSVRQESH